MTLLPPLRRRLSFRVGLLATIFIVVMWAGSVGREAGVIVTGGGSHFIAGFSHQSILIRWRGELSGPIEISLHTAEARVPEFISDPSMLGPLRVDWFPSVFAFRIDWWFVLALHLAGWGGYMAWQRHRRRRAAASLPDPGESTVPNPPAP